MPWVRRRRVRRVAAFGLLIAGLLNVVFALLWPVRWTRPVDHWLPFGIHPVSGVTAVIGGLALAGVARGVRLGYRRAWVAALVLLLVSTVYRLVRDVGLEGSVIACLIGLWLLLEHRHFRVSPSGFRRVLGWAIMTGLVVVALAAGLGAAYLGGRETRDVVLVAIMGTAVLVLATALPGREHRRTGEARARAFERARAIFDRYGGDTLDYFALRDDKSWLFSGNTLVAYSVINRVMLVSPDPIGPVDERLDAWSDAMDLADTNGWYISVLGASAPWLPIYRAAGLTGVYMGDEAIVDCQTFSLKGKSMKSLRGAYNRMSKSGYHVAVMPALDTSAELRAQLEDLATETRQGEAERGFSMTLSRMFDERDTGLLLAVCLDPEGMPVAFNQYVPASHVNGYSLDLMRRTSNPDAPNGLTDFVILETINWMAERGLNGLGLNFAVMRAVVAGKAGSGPWRSAERSLFHRFSDSMQIESLWNFNKKYDPQWRARYSVADDRAHLPRTGLAIARAESVSELPVVGRFMQPKTPAADTRPEGARVMTIRQWHLTRGDHVDGGTGVLAKDRPAAPAGLVGEVPAGRSGARRLGVIGLALVLIAAMDSIRNLPATATFGWSAIFFYGIAVLTYLVPVALCSAELATTVGGGMYRWVREAFGSRWGFLAVWCDWSENIVWFPTVLVFLATTAAYVINPNLSQNKAFLVPVMLVIFWAVTLSSLFGSLKSARWTGVGVVIGTAVPTVAIIALGLWWAGSGKHSQIPYHASAIVPAWHGLASLVYAAGIVVAFAGMEIGGFYSHVTRNVKRTYPRSVLVAAATVASLSILGSVAIAMVVPAKQIQLAGGIMQAVSIFFAKLGISSLIRPFGVLVIIGVLCGLASWSMGPAEGMRRVAADGHLNPWWGRTNRRGAPTSVLILQATLGSVLALALVFVNNINTYYWMLTALVAQTFLVMYFLMYLSVIRLRITKPDAPRPFKIPGGRPGLALVTGAGVAGALFTFFLGFIPASHLSLAGTIAYVAVMAFGMIAIVGTPFLLHRGPSLKVDAQADPNLLGSVASGEKALV